eukprot:g6394.t1
MARPVSPNYLARPVSPNCLFAVFFCLLVRAGAAVRIGCASAGQASLQQRQEVLQQRLEVGRSRVQGYNSTGSALEVGLTDPARVVHPGLKYWLRPGSGDQVAVFFHGLGCSRFDFAGAVTRVDPRWVLVALDWPRDADEGELQTLTDSFASLPALVQFADAALTRILRGPEKSFVLVGHSMGAKIAVQYAMTHPQRVQALVNVEGHLHEADPRGAREILRKPVDSVSDFCLQQVERLEADRSRAPPEAEGNQSGDTAADIGQHKYLLTLSSFTPTRTFLNQARAIVRSQDPTHTLNLWDAFLDFGRSSSSSESVPATLFIYGSRTRPKLSISLSALDGENSIEVREVSDSSHFPFFDNPDGFYSALNAFLKRLL